MKKKLILSLLLSCILLPGTYGQTKKEQQVLQVMKTATRYMMDVASYKGGFVWSYLPICPAHGEKWRPNERWHGFSLPAPRQ
ncbi:hypothetical protein [Bacteroides stercorirosoris]|uniref:hypothetical protein n=1 Tax=Bacteroides stercorirosoris TaxID=871324 RepID=UPI001FB0C8A5|nr:hypothetical protein [Bacteroides stercorirosoris]